MKNSRIVLPVFALLMGCQASRARQPDTPAPVIGASSARAAVDMYMSGMKQSSLDIVGNVWGTSDWLARDHYPAENFKKRVLIAACYIGWNGYQVTGEKPARDQTVAVTIHSTAPGQNQQTVLRVAENSKGRWFVESFDIENLTPVNCRSPRIAARD